MFEHFDISYHESLDFDYLEEHRIAFLEIERLFYGENRVFYPNEPLAFIIGYTGLRMLSIYFHLDFMENKIRIVEIYLSTDYEIDTQYCKPRCQ